MTRASLLVTTEIASGVSWFLVEFKGPIQVLVFCLALLVLTKVLKLDLLDIAEKIWIEVRELLARKWTVGSINVLAILAVLLFGVIAIGVHAFEYIAEWLVSAGKEHAAEQVKKSSDGLMLAVVLAVVALGSVAVVAKTSK
jgi:hypothetical protein